MQTLVRLLLLLAIPLLTLAGCRKQTAEQLQTGGSQRPPMPSHYKQFEDRPSQGNTTNKPTTSKEWVKISMPEGKSEIYMPGQAKRSESGKNYAYDYVGEQIAYSVRISQKLNDATIASLQNKNEKELLNAGRNVMLKSEPDAKLLNDQGIVCNGQNGLELLIESAEGFRRVRIFTVNYQLLLVVASGSKEAVESSNADAFFESFRLSSR